MDNIKIFIGSSKEGLKIANVLKILLEKEYEIVLWTDIFTPGDFTLESLLKQKDKFDFAILVATPDDKGVYRGKKVKIPRDNIIFELGLFIGCIGKERTIIVKDRNNKIKLPTDVLGINTLDFSTNDAVSYLHRILLKISRKHSILDEQDLLSILNEPSKKLCKLIQELGPFKRGPIKAKIQAFVHEKSPFKLIESFPSDNQRITTQDVKKIYLKFNNPVDKSTVPYIGNYYVQKNSFCQWNICGWIQFVENDTKLIWHVNEKDLNNKDYYGPLDIDYQRFEIHIGREPDEWRVKDIYGNELPRTVIRAYIKPEEQ
jgi:hypothetical protein